MRRLTVMIALALCLAASTAARAAMYVIENPAGNINNPADKMYNPATKTNNPASNIYNPGTRLDSRNPLSPPTQPVQESTAATSASSAAPTTAKPARQQYKAEIPQKKYYYKTVAAYIRAAKKSFNDDDYVEFLSLTEDALRRINAGTLKASANIKHKLNNFKTFGYGLLE
jgi:predicted DNA-binding protein